MKNEQAKSLNYQLIANIIYLGSLTLSVLLTYNERQELINKKTIFSNEQSNKYGIFNRYLVVALTLSFLLINYRNKNIAKKYGKSVNYLNLQISASQLTFISSLIVLYVVLSTNGENYNIVAAGENPNL